MAAVPGQTILRAGMRCHAHDFRIRRSHAGVLLPAVCLLAALWSAADQELSTAAASVAATMQPVRRRTLLQNAARFGTAAIGAMAVPEAVHAAQVQNISGTRPEDCGRCCVKDWCGCDDRVCDCRAELAARGYKPPLAVDAAYKAAGGGWAAALGWKSANIPRWYPVADANIEVKESSIQGAGKGLFATNRLSQFSVLPPYSGLQLSFQEVGQRRFTDGMEYMWCPLAPATKIDSMTSEEMSGGPLAKSPSFCVDAAKATTGNPARFVNGAAKMDQCGKVNVRICELGGVMYMQTLKTINAGTELVTSYGDNYWPDFGTCWE